MINLSVIDTLLLGLYFVALVYVGIRFSRKTTADEEDYLLAGRSLTLPLFVMTLVSTWYGGILGIGEFSYLHGIANWFLMGVPYYFFAAIFAFLLAKRIRTSNLFSIPDKLHQAYDKKTALLGAWLTFLLMTPAPYVLMLSVFFQLLFGWSLAASIGVTGVIAFSYLYWGGFRSDIATDVLQFFLMFVGFAVIIPFAVARFGGIEFLTTHLPPLHLVWHGGNSVQFMIVWFFIALWTLVDPAFHQRCYAAKDASTAQRGILISILFWFVFDLMTAAAGLYARAALPKLEQPLMAFPMLAELILPPIAKGLFFVGLLATMVSTLNTLAFVSAQTLGRDIILRSTSGDGWFGRWLMGLSTSFTEKPTHTLAHSATTLTKLGLIVSFVLSVLLALLIPSVVKIWYTIGTVVIPGLLLPLVASYFDRWRISAPYAFMAMLFGWLTSLCWLIAGQLGVGEGTATYPLAIEPMYPGLGISILIWYIGRQRNSQLGT